MKFRHVGEKTDVDKYLAGYSFISHGGLTRRSSTLLSVFFLFCVSMVVWITFVLWSVRKPNDVNLVTTSVATPWQQGSLFERSLTGKQAVAQVDGRTSPCVSVQNNLKD